MKKIMSILAVLVVGILVLSGFGVGAVIVTDNKAIMDNHLLGNQDTANLEVEFIIDGPTHGIVGVPYTYHFFLTDSEGNGFLLNVEWGDETSTGWLGPFDAEVGAEISHTWYESGNHTIRAIAKDMFSKIYFATLNVTITENHPPDRPIIAGPLQVIVGKEYNYTIGASDPDGDNVSLYIDWGDGTSTGWTYYFKSGGSFIFSHTWNKIGHYFMRAKAKDVYGFEGNWSLCPIYSPNNKAVNYNFNLLEWLSEQNSQQSSPMASSQNVRSVVPSTKNIVEDTPACSFIKDAVVISQKLSVRGHIAYAYISYDPSGQLGNGPVKFELDDPGNLTKLSEEQVTNFLSGGTWTSDWKWLCTQYSTGILYEISTDTGEITIIGGGGVNINDLAYDPVTDKLYGAGDTSLYLIDKETGSQELVGPFGSDVLYVTSIAFDKEGTCYVIALNGLYSIDVSTGDATFVGPLINCTSSSNAEFDIDNDILYLIGYTTGYMTGLYICDTETGECNLVGQFQGGAVLTALAIPYNSSFSPPVTTISFDPPRPDGSNGWYVSNVTVTLNATDEDGVNATYYRINGGEWKTYESPFIISEDGINILIEYYSIDYFGYIEEVKSSKLDIDQTPPVINFSWEVYRIGCKWYLEFYVNATDETSGMDRVEFALNGVVQYVVTGSGPVYTWVIELFKGFKSCTFGFIFYDTAGNSAIVSVKGSDINSYPSGQSSSQQPLRNQNLLVSQLLQQMVKTNK
jgi:hypothetical protein